MHRPTRPVRRVGERLQILLISMNDFSAFAGPPTLQCRFKIVLFPSYTFSQLASFLLCIRWWNVYVVQTTHSNESIAKCTVCSTIEDGTFRRNWWSDSRESKMNWPQLLFLLYFWIDKSNLMLKFCKLDQTEWKRHTFGMQNQDV